MIKVLLLAICCLFHAGFSSGATKPCQNGATVVKKTPGAGTSDDKKATSSANDAAKIYEHRLKNGLRVIVVPVDSNGLIHFGVLYGVGGVDDPPGKAGLSHLLEHMMFDGTKTVSKERLDYLRSKYCASCGGNTGQDFTMYHFTVRKEFLDLNVKIEADRMTGLTLDEKEFEREKNVVLEEARIANSDPINRNLDESMLRTFYLYSNYANPVIGTNDSIASIELKHLRKHYKKYYVPNNATLIFVGSIQEHEAVQLAEKYFGHIKPSKKIERYHGQEPLDTGISYFIEKSIPEIKIQSLQIAYSFDKDLIGGFKGRMIARFMLGILSRDVIAKVMKDEKNLICGGGVDLNLNYGQKACLQFSFQLREGVDRRLAQEEFLKIISKAKDFLTEEGLQEQKDLDLVSFKFTTDSPEEYLGIVSAVVQVNYDIDDVNNRRTIADSITLDELKDMATRVFNPEYITHVVFLHPTIISRLKY
jgi:zinc protease